MQRAIRVSANLSIIPVFSVEAATQLTPQGLQSVDQTICRLYNAEGLAYIGAGTSIRQPEDAIDDTIGLKRSLGRAMAEAGLTVEERRRVWDVALAAIRKAEQPVVSYDSSSNVVPFKRPEGSWEALLAQRFAAAMGAR